MINQQLSVSAGRSIWQRVNALAVQQQITLQQLCVTDNTESLRDCGISGNKVKTMLALNQSLLTNPVKNSEIQSWDYPTLHAWLTQHYGIGSWTADMTAIFYLGIPDIWPQTDVALMRGGKKLIHPRFGLKSLQRYQPFRSYLACYIWHYLDSV